MKKMRYTPAERRDSILRIQRHLDNNLPITKALIASADAVGFPLSTLRHWWYEMPDLRRATIREAGGDPSKYEPAVYDDREAPTIQPPRPQQSKQPAMISIEAHKAECEALRRQNAKLRRMLDLALEEA